MGFIAYASRRSLNNSNYQVMGNPRDGHCLFLACIEAMVHNHLILPPTWLSTPRKDQHRRMRAALLNTCANEFHTDPKYSILHAGLFADSSLNKGQTLFQDMCDRIHGGAYGRQSELALITCKYNFRNYYLRKWHPTLGTKAIRNPPTKVRYRPQVMP